jgi:hypothetical protein
MCFKHLLIAGISAVALTGCNTMHSRIGQEDAFFGEAQSYDAAVQTINPEPVYALGGAQPGDSGVKGAGAVRRYRTDQAIVRHNAEAQTTSTTESVSGGSSPR